MDTSVCGSYINELIPSVFAKIYVIDIMSDLVSEYVFAENSFQCKNTISFTNFYNNLELTIHPDDLKGYVDSISIKNLKLRINGKNDYLCYQYREKIGDSYINYNNIIKIINTGKEDAVLVLVERLNNNLYDDSADSEIKTLKTKQNMVFDIISNAIISLNGVMNISCTADNPEIKSITDYVNNILMDLTTDIPELSEKLTNNMILSANQGKVKTILIVDDDTITCNLLEKTFGDIYKILIAHNGQEAIDILEKNNDVSTLEVKDKIVGMFLDLNMPIVDGFGVLDYMNTKNMLTKMPVIIISGDYDQDTKNRSYTYPIADVLEKPFNVQVVKHRISSLIRLYKSNNYLNEIVLNQHQEIKNILRTIVKSYLHDNSFNIKRITSLVNIIAEQLTLDYQEYNFDQSNLEKIDEAVKYYNIGLYTLPNKMFEKEEFSDEEKNIIRNHPFIGLSIFNSVLYNNIDRIFNHYTKDIIKYCYERYDGSGYPYGISGDNIPIIAQIVSVAIEYNNLLKVMNSSSVIDEISKMSGTSFNPKIIESLKHTNNKIQEVVN